MEAHFYQFAKRKKVTNFAVVFQKILCQYFKIQNN